MSTSPTKKAIAVMTKNLMNITQGDTSEAIRDMVQGIRISLSSFYTSDQVVDILSGVVVNLLSTKQAQPHPSSNEDNYINTMAQLIAEKIKGATTVESATETILSFLDTLMPGPIEDCKRKVLKAADHYFSTNSPQHQAVAQALMLCDTNISLP